MPTVVYVKSVLLTKAKCQLFCGLDVILYIPEPPEEGSGADVELHGLRSAVFSASLQGNLGGSFVDIVLVADDFVSILRVVAVRDELQLFYHSLPAGSHLHGKD